MPDRAIVVGFDGTVGSHAALFAAINLAHATHRPVAVVHVEHTQPLAAAGTAMGPGAGAMIEMVYHLQLNEAVGPRMRFMGVALDSSALDSWVGAGWLLLPLVFDRCPWDR